MKTLNETIKREDIRFIYTALIEDSTLSTLELNQTMLDYSSAALLDDDIYDED